MYFVLAINNFRNSYIFCGFCKTVIEAEMPVYGLSLSNVSQRNGLKTS